MNEGGNVCSALTLSLDLISPRTLVCLRPRRVENEAICHKLQLVAISFLPHPIQNSFISSMTISIVSIHLGLPTLWRLATHSTRDKSGVMEVLRPTGEDAYRRVQSLFSHRWLDHNHHVGTPSPGMKNYHFVASELWVSLVGPGFTQGCGPDWWKSSSAQESIKYCWLGKSVSCVCWILDSTRISFRLTILSYFEGPHPGWPSLCIYHALCALRMDCALCSPLSLLVEEVVERHLPLPTTTTTTRSASRQLACLPARPPSTPACSLASPFIFALFGFSAVPVLTDFHVFPYSPPLTRRVFFGPINL